jgi:hypothetical protein
MYIPLFLCENMMSMTSFCKSACNCIWGTLVSTNTLPKISNQRSFNGYSMLRGNSRAV